jgi:hypothetical protein
MDPTDWGLRLPRPLVLRHHEFDRMEATASPLADATASKTNQRLRLPDSRCYGITTTSIRGYGLSANGCHGIMNPM